jgi:uncharacterized protein (TIGR03086 family)
MDRIDLLNRVMDDARTLVDSVTPRELDQPTPCTEWDVRGLIQHMAGVCSVFGDAVAGREPAGQFGSTPAPDSDPVSAFDAASRALTQAWQAPGVMDRTLKLPFGETPAEMGINVVIADQLVHAWDLATALGRPFTMNQKAAEASLQMMQQIMKPEYRGPGRGFAEEVPCSPDASLQERLLAFSGRQPQASHRS